MSMHSSPASNQLPSLIDEVTAPPPAPTRKPRFAMPKFTWVRRLGDKPKAWWRSRMDDPQKRPTMVRNLRIAAAVGVIGAGIGIYFAVRPVPQPDYLNGALDEVFNYTLLTDEFNKLPVEKRLELIGQLVQRLKSMDGDDSVLMAGFAAGIAGAARKQIEENASRLAIDMWDKYAKDYTKVPESEKSEYLDQTFLNFVKMMETVGGQPRDKPDEERLSEVRRQVARDRERLKDPNRQPKGEDLGRMFRFMDQNVGGHASPEQRTRGMMMMRDMMRHFRNQDVGTGKALPPK
jgi:hypothetical protein